MPKGSISLRILPRIPFYQAGNTKPKARITDEPCDGQYQVAELIGEPRKKGHRPETDSMKYWLFNDGILRMVYEIIHT